MHKIDNLPAQEQISRFIIYIYLWYRDVFILEQFQHIIFENKLFDLLLARRIYKICYLFESFERLISCS